MHRTALPLLLLLAACNGGSGSSGSECTNTGKALCSKAASCTTDAPKVRFLLGVDGGSGDLSFDTQSGCETLFTLGCAQPGDASTFDAAACSAALANAPCGSSTNGTGLILPSECN